MITVLTTKSVKHFIAMMEINTTNFNPQSFPITRNKLAAFAKQLEIHETFLKVHYILQRKPIQSTVKELYEEYKNYTADKKAYSNVEFCQRL